MAWLGFVLSLIINAVWLVVLAIALLEARHIGKQIALLNYVPERTVLRVAKRRVLWKLLAVSLGLVILSAILDTIVPVTYGFGVTAAAITAGVVAFGFNDSDGSACAACGRVKAGIAEAWEPTSAEVDDSVEKMTYTYKVRVACPFCGYHWAATEKRTFRAEGIPGATEVERFRHRQLAIDAMKRKQAELRRKQAEAED